MLKKQMQRKIVLVSSPQDLHYINVSTTSEKWQENFKLALVLEVSVSLKETCGEKLRSSLFVKNRSRGGF